MKLKIKGILHFFGNFNDKTTFGRDKRELIRFSLSNYSLSGDVEDFKSLLETLEEEGMTEDFIPQWVKEEKEYANFKTAYLLPVYDYSGKVEIDSDTINVGSEAEVVCKTKKGAIYPQAIRIIKDGEPINYFD